MRSGKIFFAISVICIALHASCSSAPKGRTVIVEKKNQAAEFSGLADSFLAQGNLEAALQYYRNALEANQAVDYLEGIAITRNSIGRVYLAAGDHEGARKEFLEGFEYACIAGESANGIAALSKAYLGETAYALGSYTEALALIEEALVLAAKDESSLAIVYHDLGAVKKALGDLDEASTALLKAIEIHKKLGRFSELGSDYYMLSAVSAKREDWPAALGFALQALDADKTAENSRGIGADLAAIAAIYARLDKPQEAFAHWKRAFTVYLGANDLPGVKKSLQALVELAGALGREEDKAKYAELLATVEKAQEGQGSTGSP